MNRSGYGPVGSSLIKRRGLRVRSGLRWPGRMMSATNHDMPAGEVADEVTMKDWAEQWGDSGAL